MTIPRFRYVSASLDLHSLTVRRRRGLGLCFLIALCLHVAFTQLFGPSIQEGAPKPLTVRFVKRSPRLTTPFRISVSAQFVGIPPTRPATVLGVPEFPWWLLEIPLSSALAMYEVPSPTFDRPVMTVAPLEEPEVISEEMVACRHPTAWTSRRPLLVDLTIELLDASAFEAYGTYAVVVVDPDDPREVSGFCHLAFLYVEQLHQAGDPSPAGPTAMGERINRILARPVRSLAAAVNEYTNVHAVVAGRVTPGEPSLLHMPWVYLAGARHTYSLLAEELESVGAYMASGGLLFADGDPFGLSTSAAAHRRNLEAALRTQGFRARFERLPAGHSLYHCYFDFDAPPPGAELDGGPDRPQSLATRYLEGIEVDSHLAAMLSNKGYFSAWNKADVTAGRERALQFGVNLVVFGLTQEGSLAARLVRLN